MSVPIPLADARPGMVLADPAVAMGTVLLGPGMVLTAAHLSLFATRGLRSIRIKDAVADAPPSAKAVIAADKTLRPLFAHCNLGHPAIKELYRISLLRAARRLGNEPGRG